MGLRGYLVSYKDWTGQWSSPSRVKGENLERALCSWWLSAFGEEVEQSEVKQVIEESDKIERMTVWPVKTDSRGHIIEYDIKQ